MKRLCIAALMFIVPLVYGQEVEEETFFETTDELIANVTELNLLLEELYQNGLTLASSALEIKQEVTEATLDIANEIKSIDAEKALELYNAIRPQPTEPDAL